MYFLTNHTKITPQTTLRFSQEGDREALAVPIKSTIYLAGEATHPAVNPCIQAAIETGHRAAEQVAADQRQRAAKL